jgi:hypothetical protein
MAATVLYGALESEVPAAAGEGDRLWIPLDELERATGWTAKAEGLCRGDACVPIPAARSADWLDGAGRFEFAGFASHLGHAVAHDAARGVWAFGPPAETGPVTGVGPVVAPDFRLPDLDGVSHALSDHRGKKVLLYCWSSW